MDPRHTGELGFDSLLRHFFKNLNQHLALQGPPGGQTVCHHLPTSTKPVDNMLGGEFGGWTIRKVVHPSRSNRLVDNPEVEETMMNLLNCIGTMQRLTVFNFNKFLCYGGKRHGQCFMLLKGLSHKIIIA